MIHLWSDKLRLLCRENCEQNWLSVSGGFAVGYVFIYVMPKLAMKQLILTGAPDTGLYGFLEHHAYLVALLGFIFYYGIDRAVIYFNDIAQENRSRTVAYYIGNRNEVGIYAFEDNNWHFGVAPAFECKGL